VAIYRLASDGVWDEGSLPPGDASSFGRDVDLWAGRVAIGRTRRDEVLVGGTLYSGDVGGAFTAQLVLSRGTPCDRDRLCATGACVDGVCCASACGGGRTDDCRACSVAAGAETDGECAIVAAGAHECRAAAGPCDAPESCDGVEPSCPLDDVMAAGTECRAAAGACDVPESCDGFGIECPADENAANGTMCMITDECGAWCVDGACEPMPGACDDGDVCTTDTCGPDGCAHEEIAACCRADADCDDGDPCTADTCQTFAGTCESRRLPSCSATDGGVVDPGESGGGCAAAPTSPSAPFGPVLVLGVVAWWSRRRSRGRAARR
jgi:hypothetical protein